MTLESNSNHLLENPKKDNYYCQKHQKKIEGLLFYIFEKYSLIFKKLICQAFDACNIMQEKINFSLNEISEATLILNESAEKCKSDISHFYIEIRKMLEERENQLKFKIKDQLQKEQSGFKSYF